ncbi:cell division protein ZapA [Halalkalibacillus sediminis]|uniref:Cell division protein ZapA n=1 Tax=Halalkalibacillus sediminis TaxID=2018042 RepID=A0A2I0QY17_9BACI|nr:cell division protein ZapA [Halalkalibacillus sediminis]PKR79236.1 cell division protein ZapA [Halalkalibacillus sediminis]
MSQNGKSKITVEIHNRKYTVVGEESSDHIKKVASMVDQKMDEIRHAKPSIDSAQLAVLTALNTMNDYMKLKEDYNHLKQQQSFNQKSMNNNTNQKQFNYKDRKEDRR